jgi:hypothetical protein
MIGRFSLRMRLSLLMRLIKGPSHVDVGEIAWGPSDVYIGLERLRDGN